MNLDERLAFWRAAYLACIGAGRGNSAAEEYANQAVKDALIREKSERAANEEEG